ncbi:MAG TPA: response regulator [Gemmatimonadales bacterium]
MMSNHRVLIVDDEQPVLDAVRDYLQAYGLEVDTAREREEAEALVSAIDYGLVIADMRLTGIHGREGLELVRYIREHRPRTRIIVITAHGSGELRAEVRRCGADTFLEKPIPLSDLVSESFALLGLGKASDLWSGRRSMESSNG